MTSASDPETLVQSFPCAQDWSTERVACDNCGATEGKVVYVTRFGWHLIKCKRCPLHYLNPRPTERALRDVYNDPRYYDVISPVESGQAQTSLFDILAEHGSTSGSLLEIGCSQGNFLEAAKRRRYAAKGIDVSAVKVQAARDRGLDALHGSLEEAGFVDETFDVVVMVHVVEHLPSPSRTAAQCRRILRPGGLLLLRYPAIFTFDARVTGWERHIAPWHLYYFDERSLRDIGKRQSLTLLKHYAYRYYGTDHIPRWLRVPLILRVAHGLQRRAFRRWGAFRARYADAVFRKPTPEVD